MVSDHLRPFPHLSSLVQLKKNWNFIQIVRGEQCQTRFSYIRRPFRYLTENYKVLSWASRGEITKMGERSSTCKCKCFCRLSYNTMITFALSAHSAFVGILYNRQITVYNFFCRLRSFQCMLGSRLVSCSDYKPSEDIAVTQTSLPGARFSTVCQTIFQRLRISRLRDVSWQV